MLGELANDFVVEKKDFSLQIDDTAKNVDFVFVDKESNQKYVVECKKGTSLKSFLNTTLFRSYAQIMAYARELNVEPLLIYSPDLITEEEIKKILHKVEIYTPDLNVMILDNDKIVGRYLGGKKEMNFQLDNETKVVHQRQSMGNKAGSTKELRFSDKELWMFKCWFYSRENSHERWDNNFGTIENGNQLHEKSGVSLSECYRWVNVMQEEGYMRDEGHGKKNLIRLREYLKRWNEKYRINENKGKTNLFFPRKVKEKTWNFLKNKINGLPDKKKKDYILTGFRGAAVYGYKFTNVEKIHLYRSHDNPQRLADELGLFEAENEDEGSVMSYKPKFDKAVLDGACLRNNVYIVDPLQLYLDCYHLPKRGLEQAEAIWDNMLSHKE